MSEYVNEFHERQDKYQELMTFEFEQPDGRNLDVDFSQNGSFGDFALKVNGADVAEARSRMYAYWTGEASIFAGVMGFWLKNRSYDEQVQDLTKVESTLRSLQANGFHPTDSGEAREINEYLLEEAINHPEEVRSVPMFSGGIDTLTVDPSGGENLVVASDRLWDDGEEIHEEFSVSSEDAWKFIAGMVGRSYSDTSYVQLTRYHSGVYNKAINFAVRAQKDKQSRRTGQAILDRLNGEVN